jgi:hypothetical protein
MRFDFHRISNAGMTAALRGYMNDEGIKITDEALNYVVSISDGAMRDALSLLDRLAGLYFEQEITLNDALEVTGSMSRDVFTALFKALLDGDITAVLNIIDNISAKGRDFAQFTDEFLGYLRNEMITAATSSDSPDTIISMVSHFATALRNVKQAGSGGRLALEIACIEWIGFGEAFGFDKEATGAVAPTIVPDPPPAPEAVIPETSAIEDSAIKDSAIKDSVVEVKEHGQNQMNENPALTSDICPLTSALTSAISDWPNFCQSLEMSVSHIAAKTRAGTLDDGIFYIICPDKFTLDSLSKRAETFTERLNERYGGEFTLGFVLSDVYNQRHIAKYGETKDPVLEELRGLINFDIKVL